MQYAPGKSFDVPEQKFENKISDQIMYRETPGKWMREKLHYLIYVAEIKEVATNPEWCQFILPSPFSLHSRTCEQKQCPYQILNA